MHLSAALLLITAVNSFLYPKTLTKTLFQKINIVSDNFSFYPKIDNGNITEQQKYDLQWFVIDKIDNIKTNVPYKATIKGKEYVYWKKSTGFLNAVSSKCPIDNSDLYSGYILPTENGIECINGHDTSELDKVDSFDIANKNGWVYINTYGYNDKKHGIVREFHIEEDVDPSIKTLKFFETESFLSEDVLVKNIVDIGHFTLHYLFGNVYSEKYPYQEAVNNVGQFHMRTRRAYQCDKSTLSNKILNIDNIIIQNDLYLPYTTSTKLIMGDKFVTLTCSCLPIKKNKTKIFMKVYHNLYDKVENDFMDKLLRVMNVLLDIWTMSNSKTTDFWDTLSFKYK